MTTVSPALKLPSLSETTSPIASWINAIGNFSDKTEEGLEP